MECMLIGCAGSKKATKLALSVCCSILQRLANLMACCVCSGDLSSGLAKAKKLHGLVYETLGLGLPGCAASRRKPSPNVSDTSSSRR